MKSLQSYLQEGNTMGRMKLTPNTDPSDVSTFVFDDFCDALNELLYIKHGIKTKIFYKVTGEYKIKNGVSWSVDFISKSEETEDIILSAIIPDRYIKASANLAFNTEDAYITDNMKTYVYIMSGDKVVGQLFDGKALEFDTKTMKIRVK